MRAATRNMIPNIFQQQKSQGPQVQYVMECILITAALLEDTLDKVRQWETVSPVVCPSV